MPGSVADIEFLRILRILLVIFSTCPAILAMDEA